MRAFLCASVGLVAASVALPARAASPCTVAPFSNESLDWTPPPGAVLCGGQFRVRSLTVPFGATLSLGDRAVIYIDALDRIRIGGLITGYAAGEPGGSGGSGSGGVRGTNGGGTGGGEGAQGYSDRWGHLGGGGGGGGNGGAGGRGGSADGPGGMGGPALGDATNFDALEFGGGGGGGSSGGWRAALARYPAGAGGGRGGGALRLSAREVIVSGLVDVGGGSGGSTDYGGGGGGGAGGSIVVLASERLSVTGPLFARGGAGGPSSEGNGGGGGGAGGRIKLAHPASCDTLLSLANVAGGGTRGGGTAGSDGSRHCETRNTPPQISSITIPSVVLPNAAFNVVVQASDAQGHLLKYEFDCDGDGVYEKGPQTSNSTTCSLSRVGNATVRVRVRDWNSIPLDDGAIPVGTLRMGGETVNQRTVLVNQAPSVTFQTLPAPTENQPALFGLRITDDAADASANRYTVEWRWGDGSAPQTQQNQGTTPSLSHTYVDSGTYTIQVTVTDQHGASGSASTSVAVRNLAPVVTFDPFPMLFEGDLGTFTVRATDVPRDQDAGFKYEIDWGDGTSSTTQGFTVATFQKAWAQGGTFTITARVTDKDGGVAPVSQPITVKRIADNLAPTVSILPLQPTCNEGGSVTLTATIADADSRAGDKLIYTWRLRSGALLSSGETFGPGPAQLVQHVACTDSGLVGVVLDVADRFAKVGSGEVTVDVVNVPPTVSLTVRGRGVEGGELGIDLRTQDPSPGDVLAGFTYAIDWGDGTNDTISAGASASVTHVYADSGSYTITVVATDRDGGRSARVQANATVDNVPPVIDSVSLPSGAREGDRLEFSAQGRDVSPKDQAGLVYEWDFGDGHTASGQSVSHTYADNDSYTVTVTVTDPDGASASATRILFVANAPPVVQLSPPQQQGPRGHVFSFSATATDPGSADTLSFEWDFGNGNTAGGPNATQAYSQLGTYTVTVTVTDDDGASATATQTIVVVNRLPVATAVTVSPAEPRSSENLTLTYAYSDPDGDLESGTTIEWFVDGVRLASLRNAVTVPQALTRRGQKWYAEVTPSDGIDQGALGRSNTVTIGNEPPSVDAVRITPAKPVHADTLEVAYDFGDLDGDTEDGTRLRWSRNGVYDASFDDRRRVSGPLTKGDVWTVTVTPRDGAAFGQPVQSAPVTVDNTPPLITLLDDVAVPAEGTTTQVAWFVGAEDVDGDPLSYACFLDGRKISAQAQGEHAFPLGTHHVTCEVSDGLSSVSDTFTVAVGDVPPIVNAGNDRIVDPGIVRLSAVGRDTLERPLTYRWSVVGAAEPISPEPLNSANTSFFARRRGAYELEVTVDNGIARASDRVVVTIRNVAPSANAGPSLRGGRVGEPIVLEGGASSDPNGDALTYHWERVGGPPAAFEGTTTGATARLVPGAAGELLVRLTVSDGELSDSVIVAVRVASRPGEQHPPVARAGADRSVLVGETVLLDASDSFDVDGDPLQFSWQALSGPAVSIESAMSARASFVATSPGTYVVELAVTDGTFVSRDDVTVTAVDGGGNRRPVARVSPNEADLLVGESLVLDGSASSDPDGDALTFRWRWVDGPRVGIENADKAKASIVATSSGVVELELVVSDGRVESLPAKVRVRVSEEADLPPTAMIRGPEQGWVGLAVELDGSGSMDPEGAPLSFAWRLVMGPGATVLEDAGSDRPRFVPRAAGVYTVELVVSDGLFQSHPVTFDVPVGENARPVARIDAPATSFVAEKLLLDGSGSVDPDGGSLTYAWRLVDGPSGRLSGTNGPRPVFVAEQPGLYTLELVVSDGVFESAPVQVEVMVEGLPVLVGGCRSAGATSALALGALALVRRRRGASR